MRAIVKEWSMRIGLLAFSVLLALGLSEIIVRAFFPIYDGRNNVTLDGRPIKGWFEPGIVYRQIASEYNAVTTITDKGHRVPRVDRNPDVVFIGDSFTYGFGLSDEETFPSIYGAERNLACANLGHPGSGTSRQVKRLEQFLDKWHWRPKEVKLFFFGMSGSVSSGNDFMDNLDYGRWLQRQTQTKSDGAPSTTTQPGFAERVLAWQKPLLENSTLIRRGKYNWGPYLRSALIADPGQERMAAALIYTKRGLHELDDLSRRTGFAYSVYLIVPVQDIIRGTHGETLKVLNSVSPKPVISTAPLFVDSPQDFYYAYDGHLNPRGSRRIAEMLVSVDGRASAF